MRQIEEVLGKEIVRIETDDEDKMEKVSCRNFCIFESSLKPSFSSLDNEGSLEVVVSVISGPNPVPQFRIY